MHGGIHRPRDDEPGRGRRFCCQAHVFGSRLARVPCVRKAPGSSIPASMAAGLPQARALEPPALRFALAKGRERLNPTLIPGFQGKLVGHQGGDVGGLRDREVGGQVAVQQAGALELCEAGEVLDGF